MIYSKISVSCFVCSDKESCSYFNIVQKDSLSLILRVELFRFQGILTQFPQIYALGTVSRGKTAVLSDFVQMRWRGEGPAQIFGHLFRSALLINKRGLFPPKCGNSIFSLIEIILIEHYRFRIFCPYILIFFECPPYAS